MKRLVTEFAKSSVVKTSMICILDGIIQNSFAYIFDTKVLMYSIKNFFSLDLLFDVLSTKRRVMSINAAK